MLLQYQLAARIVERFGDISLPLPVEAAMDVVSEVCDWLKALPPAYAIPCRDLDLDRKNKWLASQRTHLHTLAYMVILTLLKPFITEASGGTRPRAESAAEDGARKQGIDAAIALMEINHALYEKLYPDSLQPNLIFFAVFNTSAVLCPAIMNDTDGTLPRRAEVIACIGKALDMLHRMSSERPVVGTGFQALHKLALQLPLAVQETKLLRHKHHLPGQRQQRQQRQRNGGAVMDSVSWKAWPPTPLFPSVLPSLPRGIKRSESAMPPGAASMLTPMSLYTPTLEVTQGGEYVVQSSHVYATDYPYPYSRLGPQLLQQMPLAGPGYDGAAYANDDGHEKSRSRNGGGSSAGGSMDAVAGLDIHGGPPPLLQTTPMTELHGLDAGFGDAGLNLGGAVAWPVDMAQGPADGQDILLHWCR